jgi:hypothetical protein
MTSSLKKPIDPLASPILNLQSMAPALQMMPKLFAETLLKSSNSDPDVDPVDALLAKLRSPSAPLPDWVDEAFLASVMHFVNEDVRRMHEDRVWIRSVTGFPWPEEKPAAEDLPALYTEALKYPSFAIVVQRQFFPEDTFRGLPKNQVRRQYGDMVKRVRKEKPLPRHEKHLHVLEALQIREIGRSDGVVANCSVHPATWHGAKCSQAADGLIRMEMNEDLAPVARYLQAVLGPFKEFGEDVTIGELFESTVIPQSLRRPVVLEPQPSAETLDVSPPEASSSSEDAAADEAPDGHGLESDDSISPPGDTLEGSEDRWRTIWSEIAALSADAGSRGPRDDYTRACATIRLEDAHTVIRRKPAPLSTEEVRAALRSVVSNPMSNELHGESLNAPALLSALFDAAELADGPLLEQVASLAPKKQTRSRKRWPPNRQSQLHFPQEGSRSNRPFD